MKYEIEKWTIQKLIEIYEKDLLILNPPYQRNPIWSLNAQKMLIDTIKKTKPMPNFFLLKKGHDNFEMVDGQQRARTILGYWHGDFADENDIVFDKQFMKDSKNRRDIEQFSNYSLAVTIITDLKEAEPIEAFYSLVNSSGLRLNRPELKKAEFYNTTFLRLITYLAEYPVFRDLRLFTPVSMDRMNNVDFVSELIAFMKFSFSDKKERVDELFENDISNKEYQRLKKEFIKIIDHFNGFNSIYPLNRTRFRQKNDFYSLFAFIAIYPQLEADSLDYFFTLLLKLAPYIRPSQEECDPLMNYALNCVTQSNSKSARENRHAFLVNLLLNEKNNPNGLQKAIMTFFKMRTSDLVCIQNYFTLSTEAIHDPYQAELPL